MSLRIATTGVITAWAVVALGLWPDWLPRLDDLPDWGRKWELSDLEHSLEIHPPVEVERWLYNPRERTGRALARLETGGPDAALSAFEAAARLAPDDRRVLFNVGTGRLLADHGDAVEALERAVAEPAEDDPAPALPPDEAQLAWYNLGAARLADDDAAGAVEAFEEALRREPADTDAKHNLEVALRRLEEERLRLLPPREAPGGRREGEDEDSDRSGGTDPDDPADDDRGDDAGGGRDPSGGDREADARPEEEPDEGSAYGRRPVEGFREQADLTAAQAAALLEAVENLERRERRITAARAAVEAGAEEEDW